MKLIDPARPDSLLQRVLRAGCLVAFVLFIATTPVASLLLPEVKTQASVPAPPFQGERFRLGLWMKDLERWLQERSPVTYKLRGRYQEARFTLGLLENANVHFGRDGWFFQTHTLDADEALLAAKAPARRACLASLKRRLDELDIAILAIVAPDKTRLYPEYAYADGRMPPARERLYGLILGELAAAGIPTLDAATVLAQAKAAGGEKLFYFRDTHWTAHAAVTVGRALRPRLAAAGLESRLGPPVAFELMPLLRTHTVPDLVGALGMRSAVLPDTHAASPVVDALMEETEGLFLWVKGEAGAPNRAYADEMTKAVVALCGTSYSDVHLRWASAWFLGCLVDFRGAIPGGGPFRGLQETIARVRSGESKTRLIVWEFVERMYLESDWLAPPREF